MLALHPGEAELRVRLTWLSIFRTIATSLLLAVFALRLLASSGTRDLSREDSLVFLGIGLVYVLTLIYGLWLRKGRVGRTAAVVQVAGDILIASGLVSVTGGGDSPVSFTYSLAVIAASILLSQRGAFVTAAACSGAYGAIVGQHLLELGNHAPTAMVVRLGFTFASNVLAYFLIAALAGYLSRQLLATGGRLSASQADLKRLATLHEQILDSTPSGLLTCEADGSITFINRAALSILGMEGTAVQSRLVQELLPGLPEMERVPRSELKVDTPRGHRILGLTLAPLEGTGRAARLIVFQDLTALRRAEDELRRADRLAALGTLAAQLAHEIRNPLAAMRGSAQMLAQDGAGDPGSQRLTNILLRESDRLSRLVEEFLRFARPPKPQLRPVGLELLVRQLMEMLQVDPLSRGVELDLDLQPVAAAVDPDQVRQVLLNLLRNAFEAVDSKGKVRLSLSAEGNMARLSVWDSAGSIPESNLGRIFEPFFTTRSGGTGLGLATAYSIVRAHEGRMQVTSSPEAGTEFVVELPLAVASEEVQGARASGG
ncbi:two-component system sensor histidine kinase NtrB [Hyalangium minutum]|uniref:histidine kinase n=1 Tax=Hyalangium minutum TaxID=394096 RepID=A0A085VVU1_9BACT|nr:ATP-binding protein [Hyalangium minutum]KFE59554.1 Sensor protein of zinc sigma-54-dependent two-component system [Hyalangium minutum]